MPTPPRVTIGIWENDDFIGAILFSRGACSNMLKPYGLKIIEGCELTRVALQQHISPVSQIISIAIKLLKQKSPSLRLVVSYADSNEGHNGAIYQAGNWIYDGRTRKSFKAIDRSGREWHNRQVSRTGVKRQYGKLQTVTRLGDCKVVPLEGKHRYLYPLDRAMRRQVTPLARPYPKRAGG